MDFKKIAKIETREQYDAVCKRVDELIKEGTGKNLLELGLDNEYIREIGRLGVMGADYENEYI
jgi:hypothetical protein